MAVDILITILLACATFGIGYELGKIRMIKLITKKLKNAMDGDST